MITMLICNQCNREDEECAFEEIDGENICETCVGEHAYYEQCDICKRKSYDMSNFVRLGDEYNEFYVCIDCQGG